MRKSEGTIIYNLEHTGLDGTMVSIKVDSTDFSDEVKGRLEAVLIDTVDDFIEQYLS